jgi:hypothetical protein
VASRTASGEMPTSDSRSALRAARGGAETAKGGGPEKACLGCPSRTWMGKKDDHRTLRRLAG